MAAVRRRPRFPRQDAPDESARPLGVMFETVYLATEEELDTPVPTLLVSHGEPLVN